MSLKEPRRKDRSGLCWEYQKTSQDAEANIRKTGFERRRCCAAESNQSGLSGVVCEESLENR